jgi:hypothetical protein
VTSFDVYKLELGGFSSDNSSHFLLTLTSSCNLRFALLHVRLHLQINLHAHRLAHYALLTTHVFDTVVPLTMRIPRSFDVCVSLRELHDFGV